MLRDARVLVVESVDWCGYNICRCTMAFFDEFMLKIGRALTILGVSDPDEVKRKRKLYEEQRAARKAKEVATHPPDSSANPKA